jgi:hypothetical protein
MAQPEGQPSRRRQAPTDRTFALVALAAAVLPIVYHGVRAAVGSWVPAGDDAYFTLRSLDVATSHHPLLGAWSSGSDGIERQVNNLGPMQLDLLAPFTKVAWAGGTAIAVVTVHVVAILAIAWLSRRLGGDRQVVASMLGVALLAWVMGSEMLITPQQHQFLLLPYLCLLVATWAAASGDRWAPVVWVVAASLVAQTHLSYPILVAALALPLVAGQALAWRRDPTQRPALVRAWLVAVVVGFVLWLQTIVDQLFGWGNLTAVLATSGETTAPGLVTGARVVADVIVSPAGYLRPGFRDYAPFDSVGSDVQVALLGLGWAAIVVGAVLAHRRGRVVAAAGMATLAVAVVAGVINASRLPPIVFGLAEANYRWLWPTAAFMVSGVASFAVRVSRPAVPIVLAIVGILAVATVPRAYEIYEAEKYREGQAAVAEITEQLFDELPRRDLVGPVVIDQEAMYFGHWFGYPLGIVLHELGFDYRYEEPRQARRFGQSRVADGTEPTRLVLHYGDEALARFGAPDTVAYSDGPSPVSVTLERAATP